MLLSPSVVRAKNSRTGRPYNRLLPCASLSSPMSALPPPSSHPSARPSTVPPTSIPAGLTPRPQPPTIRARPIDNTRPSPSITRHPSIHRLPPIPARSTQVSRICSNSLPQPPSRNALSSKRSWPASMCDLPLTPQRIHWSRRRAPSIHLPVHAPPTASSGQAPQAAPTLIYIVSTSPACTHGARGRSAYIYCFFAGRPCDSTHPPPTPIPAQPTQAVPIFHIAPASAVTHALAPRRSACV